MIVAITGGRYDHDHRPRTPTAQQFSEFDRLLDIIAPIRLIHGNAIGTDRAVADWIFRYRPYPKLPRSVVPFPVDTSIDGPWPCAGNHRNRRMLIDGRAHTLIAFPGNSGTRNCISEALAVWLAVWEWSEDRQTFIRVG